MVEARAAAEILNQALPYIQKFQGQTFVIKYGGSAMTDPEAMRSVIRNVLLLQIVGIRSILVHGGGPEITVWLDKLGIETKKIDGLRVTDEETMEVVQMALAGKANKAVVGEIQSCGGKAVGLSGRDGGMLLAEQISEELGRVGKIVSVDPELVLLACESGYVPVICSVAGDADGKPLNVNADTVAAAIAVAVNASKLFVLSDVVGLLADKDDSSTLISSVTSSEAKKMIQGGQASAGMVPKLEAALKAIDGGVESVHLLNGAKPNSLLIETFTDKGIGTMVVR